MKRRREGKPEKHTEIPLEEKVFCPKCRRRASLFREEVVELLVTSYRDFVGCKWCNRKFEYEDLGEWKK